ncbi:hypothetical protein HPP92_002414 [Vanilla planifolia]|uniref:Uncharacterized protein n=1 Tax=Vanilla planifolia TaxID=51239 RepID=A0A835VHY1_VANPL|nr:hypothetical protein HPP92_002414 [Vanilla planifolia]
MNMRAMVACLHEQSSEMSRLHELMVVEKCRISPAGGNCGETRLHYVPLSFFDILFLHFPPVQRLFFYKLPITKTQLINSELPKLKQSLSIALRLFYPLAGSLTVSTTKPPSIHCSDSDTVAVTAAISSDNFYELSSNHPRAAARFHPLLPLLPEEAILSVQVTLFPNYGIAIGTTLHHAAADGSSYTHFMKIWAAISKLGDNTALSLLPQPCFDRALISDARGLGGLFIKDMKELKIERSLAVWDLSCMPNVVRATFVLGPDEIRRLGRRTVTRCSPYALACGLTWASLARARVETNGRKERFGFVTGCRPRLRPAIPAAYFGNCLGICFVEMRKEELVGERGAAAAAEAVWEVIRGLETGVFEEVENWVRSMKEYAEARALTVAGSPKLGLYGVEFGWGRPTKVELVSIEKTGALSLADSGEVDGGIEVGIALPAREMELLVGSFVAELAESD